LKDETKTTEVDRVLSRHVCSVFIAVKYLLWRVLLNSSHYPTQNQEKTSQSLFGGFESQPDFPGGSQYLERRFFIIILSI
jgi:hypothetical protein